MFPVFPCLCCLVMSCFGLRRQGGYEIGGGDRHQAAALARKPQQRSVSLSQSQSGEDFQILLTPLLGLEPSGNSHGTTSPAPGGGRSVRAPPPTSTLPPPTPTPARFSSYSSYYSTSSFYSAVEGTMSRMGSNDTRWHLLASDVVGNNTPELDTREFMRQNQKPNVLSWVVCFLFASSLCVLPALLTVECSTHPSLVDDCDCSTYLRRSRLGACVCRRG